MMKGKVQTVLGPLDPSNLGLTLTHEHLLHDLTKNVFKKPLPHQLQYTQNEAICLETLGWIRQYPYCYDVNLEFNDTAVRSAVKQELEFFKKNGGGTIVDNCSVGLRSPDQAQYIMKLSKETSVHVVAGTGFYVSCAQSSTVQNMKTESLADKIRQDLMEGMDGTDIKCGVIGEIGCSYPLEGFEKRSLASAAIVQQETGAPVIIHPGRDPKSPQEICRIFQEAGGNISHVIMSHLDRTFVNKEDLLEFASTGSYCEYDLFGIEVSYYQQDEKTAMPTDAQRIDFLRCLIDEGFGDRIVIAHDVHTKHRLMKFGGHGFSHILLNVVPQMERKGFTKQEINKILYTNPKTWLTFH